jgi:hypothetical protein
MSAVYTNTTGSVTYADSGDFGTVGKWRAGNPDSESIDAPEYGFDIVTTAGVNGGGTVNYGFRGQKISIEVVYIAATYNGVLSAIQADLAILGAAPTTLVLDGQTYYCCVLDAGATGKKSPTKSTGGGKYWAVCRIVVTARRKDAA